MRFEGFSENATPPSSSPASSISQSPTSLLWFQFNEMVDIICKSVKAERTGNWSLHFESVQEMLPYLAASGHYLYTKSSYLYLQTMIKLQITHPRVHQKFLEKGLHVVRTKDCYWAGRASDLTIEQDLMRPGKASGASSMDVEWDLRRWTYGHCPMQPALHTAVHTEMC